jgi:hypothetical protein
VGVNSLLSVETPFLSEGITFDQGWAAPDRVTGGRGRSRAFGYEQEIDFLCH